LKCLSDQECRAWLAPLGVELDPQDGTSIVGGATESVWFEISDSCRRQSIAVKTIFYFFPDDCRWLLWLREWGHKPSEEYPEIWNEIRRKNHEKRSIIEAPGHLFEPHEKELAAGMLRLAMLFGWGAFLLSAPLSHSLFISSSELMKLYATSPDVPDAVSEQFKIWRPLKL
jgi:hypothetical protein